MNDPSNKIKITLADIKSLPEPAPVPPPPIGSNTGPGYWGTINQSPSQSAVSGEKSPADILMQSWFYLSLAACLGALAAWAICEPFYDDGSIHQSWSNYAMLPLAVAFISLGLGTAESMVERSTEKALLRGVLSLIVGLILGFFFDLIANLIYRFVIPENMDMGIAYQMFRRTLAWMVFGISGGLVYGIVGSSFKKCMHGALGGIIGSGLGGFLFDPISMLFASGEASRAVGFGIIGICTGVAIGLVESALKNRWLYIVAGPLAGKQFILYKQTTIFGSRQASDIYLFKDPAILPTHAVITITGANAVLQAYGPVIVSKQSVQQRVLVNGDSIRIGKYTFTYAEREQKK